MGTRDPVSIRSAGPGDAAAIAEIYRHYVLASTATFEESAPSQVDMARRLKAVIGRQLPWLVAEQQGRVNGYAYAMPWRERSAYRYSVEVSGYVDPEFVRARTGTLLYQALIDRLVELGTHSAIAVVTLPNPASVAFHEKLGFVKVAHLEQIGFKFGRWLDAGYWQRLLDERPGNQVLAYTSKA